MHNKKYIVSFLVFAVALLIQSTNVSANSLLGIATGASLINKNLELGSQGDDVVALQTFLEANGYLKLPEGIAKGYFGNLTKIALAKYQAKAGLPSLGYFGALTRKAIKESLKDYTVVTTIPEQTLNIVENGKNIEGLSKSVQAFEQSGLTPTLTGTDSFTVFAPTNDAFAKIPSALLSYVFDTKNASILKSIIKYHIIAGTYLLKDLNDGQTLKTLRGETITIGKKDNVITINGKATVINEGIVSKNGIIYSLDTILIPSVFSF